MRMALLSPIVGLALVATPAVADTMNLGYACRVSSNTSAASTNDFNTGGAGVCSDGVSYVATKSLVCSFKNATTLPGWAGTAVYLTIFTGGPFPDFWDIGPGGCRSGAVYSPQTIVDAGPNCTNPFPVGPNAQTDETSISVDRLNGRVRIVSFHYLTDQTAAADLPPPTSSGGYLANNILIEPTGADICSGCDAPACIELTEAHYFSRTEDRTIFGPELRTNVSWNGGLVPNCLFETPAKNSTWGRIKALYR
jgi:hypothetical protein